MSERHDHSERRPRRRPGENRERLIEAGRLEFGRYGYRGASTSAIAAAAGVPQPHVYANFDTKASLFLACADRVVSEIIDKAASSSESAAVFLLQAFSAQYDAELPELRARLQHLSSRAGEGVVAELVVHAVRARLDRTRE